MSCRRRDEIVVCARSQKASATAFPSPYARKKNRTSVAPAGPRRGKLDAMLVLPCKRLFVNAVTLHRVQSMALQKWFAERRGKLEPR